MNVDATFFHSLYTFDMRWLAAPKNIHMDHVSAGKQLMTQIIKYEHDIQERSLEVGRFCMFSLTNENIYFELGQRYLGFKLWISFVFLFNGHFGHTANIHLLGDMSVLSPSNGLTIIVTLIVLVFDLVDVHP